jgi:phosphoribosylaminoimidazole-succinocarboxamide synthase
MQHSHMVLSRNDNFPIRTAGPVHSGKVRSVYWLTAGDSARLIKKRGYKIAHDSQLAVMIISDRISAFDCIWRGEGGLDGVPQKGAALNAVSKYWFDQFAAQGLADSHILESPHPLVWVVQRARPLKIEAIVRAYITGSMWRDYAKGEREICGIHLPEGLEANQRLEKPIFTPSTKGIIKGIDGIPEADDVNISRDDILKHLSTFGFKSEADVSMYERLLLEGFNLISDRLASLGQIFVDTKFEFGYARNHEGVERLIYIDEVGTPDSSRIWDGQAYREGYVVEHSKEEFRQILLNTVQDPDVLLNKTRMAERNALAQATRLPIEVMQQISDIYVGIARQIIGQPLPVVENPHDEIISVLGEQFGLIV